VTFATPPALYARWLHANRAAIAAMHQPQRRAQARNTFDATLQRIAHAPVPTLRVSSVALAAAARAELATPHRYQLKRAAVTQPTTWWSVLWGWLADRLRAFVRALAAHIKVGAGLRAAFGDSLIFAVVILVAFVGARLLRALQIARDRTGDAQPLAQPQSATALVAHAMALAQAGKFSFAIRALFGAAVILLDLHGLLRAESSATVNELHHALRAHDARFEPEFATLARCFSAVMYAERDAGGREWEEALQAYQGIAKDAGPA